MNNLFKTQIRAFEPKLSTKPVEVCSAVVVLICGEEKEEEGLDAPACPSENDPEAHCIPEDGMRLRWLQVHCRSRDP